MDFYNRIKRCCEHNGFTLSELVKSVGISTGMPTKWKYGLIPNGETLVKLADYLDVPIDYLLGREQATNVQGQNNKQSDIALNDFTYALYNETKELTKEQKEALLNMAKVLKNSSEK